jgi:hypothetical protein
MNAATLATNGATFLIDGAALILVIWRIVDVTRRPHDELSRGKKTTWVAASLGWLLFGIMVRLDRILGQAALCAVGVGTGGLGRTPVCKLSRSTAGRVSASA